MRPLAGVALVLAAWAANARAEATDEQEPPPPEPPPEESGERPPTRFLVELKFGLYTPNIDTSTGLTGTPFSNLFTNQFDGPPGQRPAGKLLTTAEFDWQFFHRFGSLALGSSLGYQRRLTHAFEVPATPGGGGQGGCVVQNADPTGPGCVRSSDSTALNVIPMTVQLVYRFDVLDRRYNVPLVPYVKAGFAYYIWWIEHNSGDLSHALTPTGSSTGVGGTAGLVAQPGLAITLDALDPTASRTLEATSRIHHTYIFAELNYAWITGMGFKNKMVFSDIGWNVGLSFEF